MNYILLFQAVIKTPEIIDSTKFLMVCHRYILNISTTFYIITVVIVIAKSMIYTKTFYMIAIYHV